MRRRRHGQRNSSMNISLKVSIVFFYLHEIYKIDIHKRKKYFNHLVFVIDDVICFLFLQSHIRQDYITYMNSVMRHLLEVLEFHTSQYSLIKQGELLREEIGKNLIC